MEPRTTIVYKGQTYPFYKTNRGKFDFENAGFTNQEILQNKTSALLALVYYTLVDCARRAGTPIKDSFEQFIDDSSPDITEVFVRLLAEKERMEEGDGNPVEGEAEKNQQAPSDAGQ